MKGNVKNEKQIIISDISNSDTIVCQYERGVGYDSRNVYRIIQSNSLNRYWEGRTLDFGNMELATQEGFSVVLLP
jgi:hypothetical protein